MWLIFLDSAQDDLSDCDEDEDAVVDEVAYQVHHVWVARPCCFGDCGDCCCDFGVCNYLRRLLMVFVVPMVAWWMRALVLLLFGLLSVANELLTMQFDLDCW